MGTARICDSMQVGKFEKSLDGGESREKGVGRPIAAKPEIRRLLAVRQRGKTDQV